MELESGDVDTVPKEVRSFIDNGPFEVWFRGSALTAIPVLTEPQVKDTAGEEEIVLTRKFGDEK